MASVHRRRHVVVLCANLLALWGATASAAASTTVVPSDRTHNPAKTPFVEMAPNVRENLERPQIVDRPEPGALQESPSRNQLRPEHDSNKNRDQYKVEKPQIIYIKNSDPKEPNGRPQLPHIDAVRRRYRFEDIPDFRQGQWWNERPQISQEYERDSTFNGQQDIDSPNEPPKSVNDDLSIIIPKLRRRKPPSANQHLAEETSAPRSTPRPTSTSRPEATSTRFPIPPWKRRNPFGTTNTTSPVVPQRNQLPFVAPPNCLYAGQRFDHGSSVATPEPCLNCTCQAGVLVCFLRVCPAVTTAPEGCFSAREPTQCCPTIVCSKDTENNDSANKDKDDDYSDDEDTTLAASSSLDDIDETRNAIGHSGEHTTPTLSTATHKPLSAASASEAAATRLLYRVEQPDLAATDTAASSAANDTTPTLAKLPTHQGLPDSGQGTSSLDSSDIGESSKSPQGTAFDGSTTTPNDFDSLIDEHLVTVVASEWTHDADQNDTAEWSTANALARRDDSPLVVTSSPELTSISDVQTEAARQNQSIPGACFSDGAWFMEGSAMLPPRRIANGNFSSSSHVALQGCSFCYCLRGRRRCVRPRCALRVPGCTPRYADPTDCCPAGYHCTARQHSSHVGGPGGVTSTEGTTTSTAASTTQRTSVPVGGCLHNGRVFGVGAVLPVDEPCRTCICSPRGAVCSPVECPLAAPACVGITPPGHCCPTEYICDTIRNTQNETEQLKIIPDPRPGSFKETHLFRKLDDDNDSFETQPPNATESVSGDPDGMVTSTSPFRNSVTVVASSTEPSRFDGGAIDSSTISSVVAKESDGRAEKTFSSPKAQGKGQSLTHNDQEKNLRLLPSEIQLETKPTSNSSQELHEWKLASNKVNVDASHLDPSSNDTLSLFYTPEILLDSNASIDAIELASHSLTASNHVPTIEEPSTTIESTPIGPSSTTPAAMSSSGPIMIEAHTQSPHHQEAAKDSRRLDPPRTISEDSVARVTKNNHLHLNLDLIDFRTRADDQNPDDFFLHQHRPIYVPEDEVDRISGHHESAPTIRPILTENNEVVPSSRYTTPPKRVLYTTEVPKYTVPVYLAEASSPAFSRIQSIFVGKIDDPLKRRGQQGTTIEAGDSSENSTVPNLDIGTAETTTESVDLEESSSTTLATYTKYPLDIDAKLSRTSNNKKSTFTVNLGSHITVAYDSAEVTTEEGITTAKDSEFNRDFTLRRLTTTTTAQPPLSSSAAAGAAAVAAPTATATIRGDIRPNHPLPSPPSSWVPPSVARSATTTELPRPTEHIFTLQQKRREEEHLTPTESASTVKLTKKQGDDITTIPGLIISTPSSLLKAAGQHPTEARADETSSSTSIPYIITTSDVINNEYKLRTRSPLRDPQTSTASSTTTVSAPTPIRTIASRTKAEHLEPSGQPSSTTASVIYRDLGHEAKSIDAQQLSQLNQLINSHVEKNKRKDHAAGVAASTQSGSPVGSSTTAASNSGGGGGSSSIDFAEGVKLFSTLLLSGLAMGNRREPTSSTQIPPPLSSISSLTPTSAVSPSSGSLATANPSGPDRRYQRPPLYASPTVAFDHHRPVVRGPQLYQFSSPIPIPVTAHPIPNFDQQANEVRLRHNQLQHHHQQQQQQQLVHNSEQHRHGGVSSQQYYVDDPRLGFTHGAGTQPRPASHSTTTPSTTIVAGGINQVSSKAGGTTFTNSKPSVKHTTAATTVSSATPKPTAFSKHHGTASVNTRRPTGALNAANDGQRVVPFLADDAVFKPIANPLLLLSTTATSKKKSSGHLQNIKKTAPSKKGSNCFIGGVTYADGDDIPKADACELCRCYFGEELCTVRRCPSPPGSDCRAEPVPGSCCPRYICKPESVTLPPPVNPISIVDDGFHQPDHPKFVPHIDILMAPQGDQRLLPHHQHSAYHSGASKATGNHKGFSAASQQGYRRGVSSGWKITRPLPSPSYNPFFPGPRRDTPPPRVTPVPQIDDSTTALQPSSSSAADLSPPRVSSSSSAIRQSALSLENEISATSNGFSDRHSGGGEFTTVPTATLEALLQHAASTVPTTTTTTAAGAASSVSHGGGGGVFSAITDIPFIRSFFKKDTTHSAASSTSRPSNTFSRDRHTSLATGSFGASSASNSRAPTPAALRDEAVFTTVTTPTSTTSTSRPGDTNLGEGQELRPLLASNAAWNLLKVSGCNIYGKFYRVNEVVTELTERCKVCTCTAIGVHCIQTCR